MTDNELIDLMVNIWLSHGGDSEGFKFCYYKILAEMEYQETKQKEGEHGNSSKIR